MFQSSQFPLQFAIYRNAFIITIGNQLASKGAFPWCDIGPIFVVLFYWKYSFSNFSNTHKIVFEMLKKIQLFYRQFILKSKNWSTKITQKSQHVKSHYNREDMFILPPCSSSLNHMQKQNLHWKNHMKMFFLPFWQNKLSFWKKWSFFLENSPWFFPVVRPISRKSSESILSLHFVAIVNIFLSFWEGTLQKFLRTDFQKLQISQFRPCKQYDN